MIIHHTNFDYEYDLFNIPIGDRLREKMNEMFNFIFFLIEKEGSLYCKNDYSKEYRDFLEKLSKREIITTQNSPQNNWWGKLNDIFSEKKSQFKSYLL